MSSASGGCDDASGVSLATLLTSRPGFGLSEPEAWAVLCQAVQALQDFFLADVTNGEKCIPLVTPNSMILSSRGKVKLRLTKLREPVSGHLKGYLAPEYRATKKYADTGIEKMWIFGLGETLRKATLSARGTYRFHGVLSDMTRAQPASRASLMHLLDVISEYCKSREESTPFSHVVMDLHQEAAAAAEEAMETPWGPPAMPSIVPRNARRGECFNEHFASGWTNIRREHSVAKLTKEASTSMEDISCSNLQIPGRNLRPKSICVPFESDSRQQFEHFRNNVEENIYYEAPAIAPSKKLRSRRNPVQRAASRLYRAESIEHSDTNRCVGPEFAVRAGLPPKKLIFPGSGKNSRTVTVILLDGQRVEVDCEPSRTTAGQLLELVIVSEKIEENFMLGLSALLAGDFVFLPSDTKISKAQECAHLAPTLYVRVRFFLPTLRGIRSSSARHLLYLQLRRSVLEHQLPCALGQLLELGGLALQAEFGDFKRREHGVRHYFLLEHYVPETISSMINDPERLREELVNGHISKKGLEPDKAEQDFINFAQGLSHYGGHFYTATWILKDNNNKDVWLYISAHGLNLYERGKSNNFGPQLYEMFEWKNIQTLCYSKHYLCILPHNKIQRSTKFKKYKLRMDHKKSYFAFRLASLHHQFFLRLRTEYTSLQTLSKQFGIPLKDIKNETNSLYKLEALTNQMNNYDDDGSVDAQTEFKIEYSPSKRHSFSNNMRKTRSAENIQDCVDEEIQNKENEFPRQIDSLYLSSLTTSEKRSGVKMGTRVFGNVSSKFSRSMENVDVRNIENVSLQSGSLRYSLTSTSKSSNNGDNVYVIDSPMMACSQALLPDFQETLSESLLEKLNVLSFAEERNLCKVTLERNESGSLGIQITEGSDGNVYIQSVIPDGPAHSNGNIFKGDQIVAVNSRSILAMKYCDALEMLKGLGNKVEFILSRAVNVQHDVSYRKTVSYQSIAESPIEKHLTENCYDIISNKNKSNKDDLSYKKHIRYEVENEIENDVDDYMYNKNLKISQSCTTLHNYCKIVDMIPKKKYQSLDRKQFKNLKENNNIDKMNIPPIALPRSLGLSRKWRGPVKYPVTPIKNGEENNFLSNESDEEYQVFI